LRRMAADEQVMTETKPIEDSMKAEKENASPALMAKEGKVGQETKKAGKAPDGSDLIILQDLVKTLDPRRTSALNVVFVGIENLPPLFPEISDDTRAVVDEYGLEEITAILLKLETAVAPAVTEDAIVRALVIGDLGMPEEKARLIAGALQARSDPLKRSIFVAQHNLHSLGQVAGAVKDGVVGGAVFAKDKVVEGVKVAKDGVVHSAGKVSEKFGSVADENQVLGSRRLRQLADVVAEPDKVVAENNTLLGSRRLAGFREVLFGPQQSEDVGIYGHATMMTEEERKEAGLATPVKQEQEVAHLETVKEGEETPTAGGAGQKEEGVKEPVKEKEAEGGEQAAEEKVVAEEKEKEEEKTEEEKKVEEKKVEEKVEEEEVKETGVDVEEGKAEGGEATAVTESEDKEEKGSKGKGKGKGKGKAGKSTAL